MVAKTTPTGKSRNGKDTPIELASKRTEAVRLRASGVGYDSIALQLGYANASGAFKAVQEGLRDSLRAAGSEDLRAIEAERLDRMQMAVWDRATTTHTVLDKYDVAVEVGPDPAAIATVLKIMDRRAKLLGLDAPVMHQIDATLLRVDRDQQQEMIASPRALQLACDLDAEIINGTPQGHDAGQVRPLDQ